MVYRGAVLNQLLIRQNCLLTYLNSNLSDKTNTSDFNNLKNSIVMVNVTGFAIGIDGNNVIIQWLTGENREFGYALNIGTTDGTMQFFYRENGTWKPSWNK